MPNWKLIYTGLTKIDFIKQYLTSVTVSTAYQSTYSVGNYNTNPLFVQGENIEDAYGNFIPNLDIGQVNITEQFAPLINLDMVWVNSLLAKIAINMSRNLSMSFTNSQLTEIKSNEYIVGLGYRIKDVVIYVKGMNTTSKKKKKLKSDINLKANVSVRNNSSVLRNIALNSNQISAGQQVISINTSADYQLSNNFTVRLYFDKVVNEPYVSSQFPNSNTDGGVALKFSLK
jgi:cell surface protein SprA